VRLASFIEPLANLTMALALSAYSVSFLMLMCIIIVYGFAVMATQIIGNDPVYLSDAKVQSEYGSVTDSMWTLTIVNLKLPGNSKKVSEIDGLWVFFFLFYVLMIVGLFNLAIGLLGAGLKQN